MDYFTALLRSTVSELFANNTSIDLAVQSGVLLVATLVGWFIHSRLNCVFDRLIADSTGAESRVIALRATKRLTFSLTFAILILLAYGLFELLEYPVGLFQLAWPLAFVLAVISILVFLLRVAAAPGVESRGLEWFVSITLWTVFALYLIGWLPIASALLDSIAFSLGEVRISLLGIVKFLIVLAVLELFALAASRYVEGRLSNTNALDSGIRIGMIKLIRYGLIGIAGLVALSVAGFDLTTLTVLGGALGIGIGFGLQKVTSNLISGFLLLFDRSVRPGDVISIGESYGWVEKMGARYLQVKDSGGVDTLIPNEELITTRIINWSYGDHHVRLKLPVKISYGDDPKLAMRLLLEASTVNDRVIGDPAPLVHLMGFGDDGIKLELRVWIDDPEQGVNKVRSDINIAIWDVFKAHGITIPYPQRDLHIKRSEQIETGTSRQKDSTDQRSQQD
jgi:small-conductance mechanosensitive channel